MTHALTRDLQCSLNFGSLPHTRICGQYLARLAQHSITIMRMESHRTDLIPCILLVNSAVRDTSAMIKAELVQRLPGGA
jgi:hypothetical protein